MKNRIENEEIKFGIHQRLAMELNYGSINGLFRISHSDYILTSQKAIIRMRQGEIIKTVPIPVICATYSPDLKLLFIISTKRSELSIIPVNDLNRKLIDSFPLNNIGITHLLFSKKSGVLVTYGEKIKVYNLNVTPSRFSFDKDAWTFTIKEMSTITPETPVSLLSMPQFDFSKEKIILHTSNGVRLYDLMGNAKDVIAKVPLGKGSIFSYEQHKKNVFVYDIENGISIINDNGKTTANCNLGNSPLFTSSFIDKENILCMNSKLIFYIVNKKTNREIQCLSIDAMPSRIFYSMTEFGNEMFLLTANRFSIYEIVIPWRVWVPNVQKTQMIARENKMNAAARILLCTSTLTQFFSPRNKECLLTCSAPNASIPCSTIYDRGTVEWDGVKEIRKEEQLISCLDNGTVTRFEFDKTKGCIVTKQISLKSKKIIKLFIDKPYYGILTNNYEFMVYDFNLNFVKRYTFPREDLIDCVYYAPSQVLIFTYKRVVMLDLIQQKQVCDMEYTDKGIFKVNGDFLYCGLMNGSIQRYSLCSKTFSDGMIERRSHSDAITDFAFNKSKFWISISLDKTMNIWDDTFMLVRTLRFPFSLCKCCYLNGHRDILVATDSEIMIVNHKYISNEEDEENPLIDNYDKLRDDSSMRFERNESEDEEETAEEKKEEDNNKPKENKKKKNRLRDIWDIHLQYNNFSNGVNQQNAEEQSNTQEEDEELARKQALEEMLNLENQRYIPQNFQKETNEEQDNKESQKTTKDNNQNGSENINDNDNADKDNKDKNIKKVVKEKASKPKKKKHKKKEVRQTPDSDAQNNLSETISSSDDSDIDDCLPVRRPQQKYIVAETFSDSDDTNKSSKKLNKKRINANIENENDNDVILSKSEIITNEDEFVQENDSENDVNKSTKQNTENSKSSNTMNDSTRRKEIKSLNVEENSEFEENQKNNSKKSTDSSEKKSKNRNNLTNSTSIQKRKQSIDSKRERDVKSHLTSRNGINNPKQSTINKIVQKRFESDYKRAQSPPQIRKYQNNVIVRKRRFIRCRTPPIRVVKKPFTMPPPCVVIDKEELMKQYIRGRTEFLPLIIRLKLNVDAAPMNLNEPDSSTTKDLKEENQKPSVDKLEKHNQSLSENEHKSLENKRKDELKSENPETEKRRISVIIHKDPLVSEENINYENHDEFQFQPKEPILPPLQTNQSGYHRRFAPQTASLSQRTAYPSNSEPLFVIPPAPEPIPPLKIIHDKQRLQTGKMQYPYSARPSFKWSFQPQRIPQKAVCPLEYSLIIKPYRSMPTSQGPRRSYERMPKVLAPRRFIK